MFFGWLSSKNTAVIMCGNHGQLPPFTGLSPHEWLKKTVDYYEDKDHKTLDEELKTFKKTIRLQQKKPSVK